MPPNDPPAFTLPEQQKQKDYEWIRGQIVHEDNLINHRLTWLLLAQGFLFVAFGTIHTAVLAHKPLWWYVICLESVLFVVYLSTIWLCIATGTAIASACEQWSILVRWWYTRYPEEAFVPQPLGVSSRGQFIVTRLVHRLVGWCCPWAILPSDAGTVVATATRSATSTLYPPITGFFRIRNRASIRVMPFNFLVINLVLVLASLVFGSSYTLFGPAKLPIKIEYEKRTPDTQIKMTIEADNDRQAQDIANKIKEKLP